MEIFLLSHIKKSYYLDLTLNSDFLLIWLDMPNYEKLSHEIISGHLHSIINTY